VHIFLQKEKIKLFFQSEDDFDDPQLMEKITQYQNKWLKEQIQTVNSFIENSKFEDLHNTNINDIDLHVNIEEYNFLNNEQKAFLMEHEIDEEELKKTLKRFEHMRIKMDLLGAKLRVKDFKGLEKTQMNTSELDQSIGPIGCVLPNKSGDPRQILLDYIMS
jgi:hypothetical protein